MQGFGTLVRLSDASLAKDSFQKLKDLGFSYCHLVYKPQRYSHEDARIIKAAAEEVGLTIVAMFAGYNDSFTKWDLYEDYKLAGINSKKHGKKRIAYVKEAAAFAKEMGVSDVLIHAGFIANDPFSKEYRYMKKCLTAFCTYCRSIGVNVLLETGGESPVTLLRILSDMNLDNVFVNLDTANVIMYGYGNPVDAVYTLKNHIRSLHLKDGVPPTTPNALGKEVPMGEGFVDFCRVFEQLGAIGFDGPLIFEREIQGEKQLEDIQKAIRYLDGDILKE